jgi:hypothetical protein
MLKSCWNQIESCGDDAEMMLNSRRNHIEIIMIMLKPYWNHAEIMLKSCWNRVGIVLQSC